MKVEALKLLGRFFHVLLNKVILLIIVQNEVREAWEVDGLVGERVEGEIRLSVRFGIVLPLVGKLLWLHLLPVCYACAV